ncbi:MAG: hypothetical protein Q8N18_08690 [Opitutaceae bacterium]|nr:hypothetical protein [Opitutaceae bacterium]
MNRLPSLLAPLSCLLAPFLAAQSPEQAPPIPPPIVQAPPRALPANPSIGPSFGQRGYGLDADTLISRQTADGILEGFKKAYVKDGAPRVVIYVNRALIDPSTGRAESTETSGSAPKTGAAQRTAPALADQQTVRDIERLFGRAFRHAGAQLADQKIAASLLPDTPGAHLTGEAAAKDRQAFANIADVAIEVLISSRNLTVPEVSGDVTVPVPDIQATAIRLKDSAIIGQAAASDIIGKGVQAGRVIRLFGVADITEATALALMEDMLIGKK